MQPASEIKMSEIKLSEIVIEGLKHLNTVISSDLTKKIISNAVKMALHSDASKKRLIIDEWKQYWEISIKPFMAWNF